MSTITTPESSDYLSALGQHVTIALVIVTRHAGFGHHVGEVTIGAVIPFVRGSVKSTRADDGYLIYRGQNQDEQ